MAPFHPAQRIIVIKIADHSGTVEEPLNRIYLHRCSRKTRSVRDSSPGYVRSHDHLHRSVIQKQTSKNEISTACQIVPQSVISAGAYADPQYSRSTTFIPMILAGLSAYAGSEPTAIPVIEGHNLYLGSSPSLLDRTITRVMAAYAVVVGLAHSHRFAHAFSSADVDGSYLSNLLLMTGLGKNRSTGAPHANGISLIEKVWSLGADRELSNSTSALLHMASTLADPISCIIVATTSSYGPLHFDAAESGPICSRLVLQAMWPKLLPKSRRESSVSWVLSTEHTRAKIHESSLSRPS